MEAPPYIDPAVSRYLLEHSTGPDELLDALAEEIREVDGASAAAQLSPGLGRFLTMIVQVTRARTVVEAGAFTGYASLCLARGLPPRGRLTCFAPTRERAELARRHWERAGVADRITLRIGPPAERLRDLPFTPAVDLAFVDAGGDERSLYYRMLLPHLGAGGLMLVNDTLQGGVVAHPAAYDETTPAVQAFNELVAADDRVSVLMLPLAGGLTMIRRHHGGRTV
ncbi:O-methyltransferase [Planomonospora alba]